MSPETVTYDCSGDEPVCKDQCCTMSSSDGFTVTQNYVPQHYLLYINSRRPVAEIYGSFGGGQNKIRVQLDKKLNFRQRLICWFVGLKYIKYEIL